MLRSEDQIVDFENTYLEKAKRDRVITAKRSKNSKKEKKRFVKWRFILVLVGVLGLAAVISAGYVLMKSTESVGNRDVLDLKFQDIWRYVQVQLNGSEKRNFHKLFFMNERGFHKKMGNNTTQRIDGPFQFTDETLSTISFRSSTHKNMKLTFENDVIADDFLKDLFRINKGQYQELILEGKIIYKSKNKDKIQHSFELYRNSKGYFIEEEVHEREHRHYRFDKKTKVEFKEGKVKRFLRKRTLYKIYNIWDTVNDKHVELKIKLNNPDDTWRMEQFLKK